MPESQVNGRGPDHEPAPNQHRTSTEPADVVGTWTGAKAAALRTASRYSQEAFAAHLGISARTVAKWHQHPDAVLRPVTSGMLDTVLRLAPIDVRERFALLCRHAPTFRGTADNAEAVDLSDSDYRFSDDEYMIRRQFLLSSAAALAAVGLPGLAGSGKTTPRLSAANVASMELVTDAQRRLYHVVPARSLWSAVRGHLALLIELVRGPQPEQVRRQVAALGGEAAGLLAWLALDLGEDRRRENMYDIALSLTAEAEDWDLGAYVQGFRSQVRQFEGRPHAALALANEAVETAAGQRTSVHAWLRSRQAVALAEVQDQRGSMAALSAAEAALAASSADEPAWMYRFDDVRLTAVRGDCLLRLDRPAHAEEAYQDALTASPGGSRFRVELLTGLATAVARQGRVDEACGLGMQSLDLAADGSEVGVTRVRQLRRDLDRWHDMAEVVALDGRLQSV
jgi:DNA-binding transcriptional regulator YiaG/tetratricopeptide (TPR) repeat protein